MGALNYNYIFMKGDLIKQEYIVGYLNREMELKNISKTKLSEKMGYAKPSNVTNVLNGYRNATDKFLRQMALCIGMGHDQIDELFMKAEIHKIKKVFGDNFLNIKDFSVDDLLEVIAEKEGLSKEKTKAVRDFINYQKML